MRSEDGSIQQDQGAKAKPSAHHSYGLLVVVAALVGGCWVYSQFVAQDIDDAAFSTPNYQAAVPDLIRLCQTDPALLQHGGRDIDPGLVPALARLQPKEVTVGRDSAVVAWGGSFHHAGWHLDRDTDADPDAKTNTWTFRLYGDGGRPVPQEALTFVVPKTARFSAAELAAARAVRK